MPNIIVRDYPHQTFDTLIRHGFHPVLARVYSARGIEEPGQLEIDWSRLIPFARLKNATAMAQFLATAIALRKRLLIVADYDSDGATACAVGIRALRKFGAQVDYLVPNRFEYGYGLTPEIVRVAAAGVHRPDILITVDNGIASVEGVAEANRLGMQVLVTDHHLPGDTLPEAAVIVNPNQPGCDFPSKHLSGVGVMFYVMLALRAELRAKGMFASPQQEPNLGSLLDLVALGTVADVVKLDDNNRLLVQQGLKRIRKGSGCAGINALINIACRNFSQTSTYELGFMIGPRLNAAGRLDDMSLGIECLITDDPPRAAQLALQLDTFNRKRQEIESHMRDSALNMLENIFSGSSGLQDPPTLRPPDMPQRSGVFRSHDSPQEGTSAYALTLFDPGWHQGVIGILASRIKDKFHRPVITFAPGGQDELKGSGRSIPGFHLRDALDLVSKRYPGLLLKFGGHSAAAGLTIRTCDFEKFRAAFEQTARELLGPADLKRVIETDGDLDESEITLELAEQLVRQVWGQGFPQPAFRSRFHVEDQRVVGQKHLKLKLRKARPAAGNSPPEKPVLLYDAILFLQDGPLPGVIDAVYRLQVNDFKSDVSLQFILEHWSEATMM
ncbi:single-stranded-DNA-specific exonuclease RecJ [Nitrosospira multiformis]|uniref:single-stranded-DNA-specific exonuclease RecJ n=1 Tax=Nitrosospira multiformis TaxID=1231 RepID=UPI000895C0EE|nr:single-stranded-DNA-specific exonuclease RecJ [Nitrosospira multiformis]SEA30839.1 exonuclease RecJ [Nitrosospira multiformis]